MSDPGSVRSWCVACHLSALAGFVFPVIGHVLGPLIVWLIKRGESPEIDAHGKEALNFQISMFLYSLVAGVLCLIVIGIVLLVGLYILNLVLIIIAALRAGEGKLFRYPMTIRLVR